MTLERPWPVDIASWDLGITSWVSETNPQAYTLTESFGEHTNTEIPCISFPQQQRFNSHAVETTNLTNNHQGDC